MVIVGAMSIASNVGRYVSVGRNRGTRAEDNSGTIRSLSGVRCFIFYSMESVARDPAAFMATFLSGGGRGNDGYKRTRIECIGVYLFDEDAHDEGLSSEARWGMRTVIRRMVNWWNGPVEAAWQRVPLWVKGGVYAMIGVGYMIRGWKLYRNGNQLDAWEWIGTGGFVCLLPLTALVLSILERKNAKF